MSSAPQKQDIEWVGATTPLQQSMLYRSRTEPNSGHYIEQVVLRFHEFDRGAMQAALQSVVQRHRALRTFFVWREQPEPRAVALKSASVVIEDCSHNWAEESQRQADRIRGIELTRAPLMRVQANSAAAVTELLWTFHHAVLDGWSIQIIIRDLLELYGQLKTGQPVSDAKPSAPQIIKQPSNDTQQLPNWPAEGLLAALPQLGRLEPAGSGTVSWHSCAELAERTRAFCKAQRLTFSDLVHGAFALTQAYLLGEDRVLFGSIDSGRDQVSNPLEAVGMLMQLIPAYADCDGQLTTVEFLQTQQQRLQEARSAPPTPQALARSLARAAGTPLFDAVVIVQNLTAASAPPAAKLLDREGFEQADAPVILSIASGATGLAALWRFSGQQLSDTTVEKLSAVLRAC